jgi:hypothetical protein
MGQKWEGASWALVHGRPGLGTLAMGQTDHEPTATGQSRHGQSGHGQSGRGERVLGARVRVCVRARACACVYVWACVHAYPRARVRRSVCALDRVNMGSFGRAREWE